MRVGQEGAARQKFLALKKVAMSGENEARKFLLSNLVETYLVLEDQEREVFERLLETEETGEVQAMIGVYEERGIKKGELRVILEMLRHKFGEVPIETRTKIESLASLEELDRLVLRVLDVDSLTEFETGL